MLYCVLFFYYYDMCFSFIIIPVYQGTLKIMQQHSILRNDLFFEHDNRCVYKNYIVKNLSNDIRTEKPDWLIDNNYLRKRFCYFIFMSRHVIHLFFH